MPQPSKYATHALRQAAYLQRKQNALDQLLKQKGLPTGPIIPSIPGTVRWNAAIKQAKNLIEQVVTEIQTYHDQRTEKWQESPQAETLLERMEALKEVVDLIDQEISS